MKTTITLLIIGLTVFLWGCGDDTEETSFGTDPDSSQKCNGGRTVLQSSVTLTGAGT